MDGVKTPTSSTSWTLPVFIIRTFMPGLIAPSTTRM